MAAKTLKVGFGSEFHSGMPLYTFRNRVQCWIISRAGSHRGVIKRCFKWLKRRCMKPSLIILWSLSQGNYELLKKTYTTILPAYQHALYTARFSKKHCSLGIKTPTINFCVSSCCHNHICYNFEKSQPISYMESIRCPTAKIDDVTIFLLPLNQHRLCLLCDSLFQPQVDRKTVYIIYSKYGQVICRMRCNFPTLKLPMLYTVARKQLILPTMVGVMFLSRAATAKRRICCVALRCALKCPFCSN